MWLMAGCGSRIGEACAVTLQEFDFEEGTLNVDRRIAQDGENVMQDAPERLRLLMDAVFTMETELHLPLESESVLDGT
ncbi:hypothetical protein [Streptomyces zaomyceticus]|uniref:hypothetical protein n=1 Tax=Streptomyces zaomyceticus TaxID=68286 RepID=UPI0034421A8C